MPTACVIGAGAAGLTVAHALAARGWKIVIVEGGSRAPARELEDTYRVTVSGTPHRGVHEGRFRAWGGSTTRWGGQLWPWEPHEFAPRPEIGIGGWPIGFDEIGPWYRRAFALLGIPDAPLSTAGAYARGVAPAGLDPALVSIKYSAWLPWRLRNLGGTIGKSLRAAPDVMSYERTTAVGFELHSSERRVTGVRVRRADGSSTVLSADVVVMAAGTLENVRLLLASNRGGQALGDHAGWLGRCFMDHLSVRVARFQPRDAEDFGRRFAPVYVGSVQHTPRMVVETRVARCERILGAYGHWEVAPEEGSALWLVREQLRLLQAGRVRMPTSRELAQLTRGAREIISLGWQRVARGRRAFPAGAAIHLRVDSEQRPDPESRIMLADGIDAYGLPRLAHDWRVSELERRTVRRTTELLAAELERQGIGVVESLGDPFDPSRPWGELRGDAYHMMGGTRMAASESDGVVDTDGRVFRMDNLYVAGASIFPTGGMANPTLTLIALAMRLGEHLATREPAR